MWCECVVKVEGECVVCDGDVGVCVCVCGGVEKG